MLVGGLRMTTWFPVAVTLLVAGVIVGVMCTINMFLGPSRPNAIKSESFECGNPPSGSAWGRFSVRFYLTAILFLIFDVEVIFLYPWAVELRYLGMFGFVGLSVTPYVYYKEPATGPQAGAVLQQVTIHQPEPAIK